MIKVLGDALPVGPILIGAARPAHILTPSTTARGVVNMTAVAALEAQQMQEDQLALGFPQNAARSA
jgi:malate dehydrogenase (oxaloacetate-decarboxylating)(NADP+)